MTIQELYSAIGGDYSDVLRRLPNDQFVARFVRRFASDDTFEELKKAIAAGDPAASFEAAHKFKGIAANLSFTALYRALIDLTDQLRSQTEPADPALWQQVQDRYYEVMEGIRAYEGGGV